MIIKDKKTLNQTVCLEACTAVEYRIRPFKRPGRLKKGWNGGRLLRPKSGHDDKVYVYNSTTELHSDYL